MKGENADHDTGMKQPKDRIVTGDALEELSKLSESSIHTCVTDPPYGLAFMGRSWDDFEPKEYQEWCEVWAAEVKRVLKPGGHLLAFSGNRTHHRLFTGVEDAGFEIRDTLTWHYSNGFPKAADVSKTIDKRERSRFISQLSPEILEKAGVPNPQATHHDWTEGGHVPGDDHWETLRDGISGSDELRREVIDRIEEPASSDKFSSVYTNDYHGREYEVTAPATEEAEKWDGWKTGLKPATEFVVMARKPFDGATADCVLKHGTGALDIDGCRVEYRSDDDLEETAAKCPGHDDLETSNVYGDDRPQQSVEEAGRYPANVVFDEAAAKQLDGQSGDLEPPGGPAQGGEEADFGYQGYGGRWTQGDVYPDESGGASRFFYTSKASKAERTMNGRIENDHPTVKPQDLMEWLVTLVSREGQTVLDPFAGSGTTCRAAKALDRRFVGIEQQAQWADVARVRCGLAPNDPSHVRGDDGQTGIEAYTDGGET